MGGCSPTFQVYVRVRLPLLSKLFPHPSSSKRPLTASGVPEAGSLCPLLKFHFVSRAYTVTVAVNSVSLHFDVCVSVRRVAADGSLPVFCLWAVALWSGMFRGIESEVGLAGHYCLVCSLQGGVEVQVNAVTNPCVLYAIRPRVVESLGGASILAESRRRNRTRRGVPTLCRP